MAPAKGAMGRQSGCKSRTDFREPHVRGKGGPKVSAKWPYHGPEGPEGGDGGLAEAGFSWRVTPIVRRFSGWGGR